MLSCIFKRTLKLFLATGKEKMKAQKKYYTDIFNLWEIQCCNNSQAWSLHDLSLIWALLFSSYVVQVNYELCHASVSLPEKQGAFEYASPKTIWRNLLVNTQKTLATSIWHQGSCLDLLSARVICLCQSEHPDTSILNLPPSSASSCGSTLACLALKWLQLQFAQA